MLLLRVLGKLLLLIAFLALAYDGARTLATPGQGILFTSLAAHLKTEAPWAEASLQKFVLSYAPSYVWSGIVEPMLVIPVSILCGAAGTLIYLAGYRRPPPEIEGD
jgi:hypothetical protein